MKNSGIFVHIIKYMGTKSDNMEQGFIKAVDMDGKSYRRLLHSAKEGNVMRLKRGVYAKEDALANTMIDVDKVVPGGILCLYSAWEHYQMTTQIPSAYFIAIDRDRKVVVPEFPVIQLVYQSRQILSVGNTRTHIQGFDVSIYDRERCVCDAIKYRNKVGLDVMAEILKSYLKSPGRNIELLRAYAEKLRVLSTLHRYLEIQL